MKRSKGIVRCVWHAASMRRVRDGGEFSERRVLGRRADERLSVWHPGVSSSAEDLVRFRKPAASVR